MINIINKNEVIVRYRSDESKRTIAKEFYFFITKKKKVIKEKCLQKANIIKIKLSI